MKKILIALLIGTVSSVSLAKGGFFQSCRDPNTGTVTYSSDCLDIPKKASPYAVNDDRDQVVSIRKILMTRLVLYSQMAILSICINRIMELTAHF